MKERQQFVEQFYGQVPGYDVPIDFGRKPGPLARMNQTVIREEQKLENGGPGRPGEQRHPARPARAAGAPRAGTQAPAAPPGGRALRWRRRPPPAGRSPAAETGPHVRTPGGSPAPSQPPTAGVT